MNKTTAIVVTAPQFGKGANALRAARRERDEAVAKQKEAVERQGEARLERSNRVKKAQVAIETLLAYGDYEHKFQAREIAKTEIRWLLEVMSSADGQDRNWAANKALSLTAWQGMCIFQEVEDAFSEVFGDNIPDDMAEKLARLISRQAIYIAKKKGVKHPGKTAKDHESGAHGRYEKNRHVRATGQSARAKAHEGRSQKK